MALTNTYYQTYVAQRWHQFLIYIGLTLGAFVINAFMNSILPMIYRGACKCVLGVPTISVLTGYSLLVNWWLRNRLHYRSCLRLARFQFSLVSRILTCSHDCC
jgi:hypothetical protein